MLRVALTGGLGSGKSTAAAMFARNGAHVLQADEVAKQMMEPGQEVYQSIADHFGPSVLDSDRRIDRGVLSRIAFNDGRVEELNAIVHPAVIAFEETWAQAIGMLQPHAVCMIESALIFETKHGAKGIQRETKPWKERFDRVVLVAAPNALKIQRYVERVLGKAPHADPHELEAEAKRRLTLQWSDEAKATNCDFILNNDGDLAYLLFQIEDVWKCLLQDAAHN